ncbi:MAG: DUF6560 family protein [Finegoldia sp.]|nr:DUF6560 family protein [Finegoldia sp.]
MQSVISSIIISAILAFISGLVMKESKRHGRSLKKFTVQTPSAYCKTIGICGVIFATFLPIIFLYNGFMGFGWNLDPMAVKFFVIFEIIFIAIGAVSYFWRLEVNGDEITYRSFYFTTRRFNIHDLTEVRKGDEFVTLYTQNGKIASLDNDFIGLSNLFSRCEKEGIPVLPAEQRVTSKWVLIVHSMHGIFIIDALISVIYLIAMLFAQRSLKDKLEFALYVFLSLIMILTVWISSFLILKGLRLICVQEKVLGFSFDEEMRRLNIRGKEHIDKNWYITADFQGIALIALNRNFIKNMKKINKARHSSESTGYRMEIVGIDGKTYKFEFFYEGMRKDIMDWWQGGNK